MHRLRRHLPLRARAIVLALCALMLMVQPVFAAVGELHELAHDPSGNHHGLLFEHGHDHSIDAASTTPDHPATQAETLILHALLASAHCCGAGAAMVPLIAPVARVPHARVDQPLGSERFPQRRLPAPFRPPSFV
ncbi:MAG TPA: hypothetical protein VFJ15_07140 [Oleiagrimonas sp.]|nr:hypothetical protein [Oleiagrimonas sp.]